MKLSVAAKTDTGRLCDHNEDYYVARRDLGLYMVADGVGGAEAGELASQVACQLVERAIRAALEQGPPASHHSAILSNAIREASRGLLDYAQREGRKGGLGTTLTALWFHGDRVLLAYVGDSRIYLYRDGVPRQLSRDEKAGRYRLAASLGSERPVEPHLGVARLRRGDRLLLCTDGLHGALSRKELTFILDSHRDPAECCERLVLKANEAAGSDNITALIADVAEPDPAESWRFAGIRWDATSPMAHLAWLAWVAGISAVVLAAVLIWWLLAGRSGGGPRPLPSVPARPAILAQEANEKARAGDAPGTLAALKELVRAAVREALVLPRADLPLDPAAAEHLERAAEAVWDECSAPSRQKLDAIKDTPAEAYIEAALRATRERLEHVHKQFREGDYRFVAETFESLGTEVDTLIARARTKLDSDRENLATAIRTLRRTAEEFAAGDPLREALERRIAAATKALEAGKLSDARKHVDAAEAAVKAEPEGTKK